jgi:hypothetical protein
MRTSLAAGATDDLVAVVEAARHVHRHRRRRGAWHGRQPVHTVYVPADRLDRHTVSSWGREAARLLATHAPTADDLAGACGVDAAIAAQVRERVAVKLADEPVEDLRIDFEDGYGTRDDDTEDADAVRAAAVAAGDDAPAFVGLRVKSFADGGHRRAIRTLDGFVTRLLDATGGTVPDGFVVTFPKVIAVAHVEAFAEVLGRLERALGLAERRLAFEIQIETVESVIGHAGRVTLPALVDAHFGVFDYTAACGLPADQQRLDHPACDFARHIMQVTLAGTGVRLSDGSTNRTPADDTTAAVRAVWGRHAALVRHSLTHGFPQGWDMHPSHLAHLDDTIARLAAWSEAARDDAVLDRGVPEGGAGEATHDGSVRESGARNAATVVEGGARDAATVVDEPATIRALLTSLQRAVDCGAVEAATAWAAAGIDPATLEPGG